MDTSLQVEDTEQFGFSGILSYTRGFCFIKYDINTFVEKGIWRFE